VHFGYDRKSIGEGELLLPVYLTGHLEMYRQENDEDSLATF
jgi:hypothetical protein